MWKNIRRYIIPGIIFIALVVFFFVKFYVFKESATTVASQKADFVVEAGDLLSTFEKDEKVANDKYLNKIVEVKGLVDNVTDTKDDITVYIKQKGKTSGIMCSFDKKEFKRKGAKSGDEVSVKGICSGYLMDVILNKCAVVR